MAQGIVSQNYLSQNDANSSVDDVKNTVDELPKVLDDSADISLVVSDNPLVASDEDLIEKDWIEKAKKIISEYKEDPYMQDEEVNKLQADYIEKRYGRKIGSS